METQELETLKTLKVKRDLNVEYKYKCKLENDLKIF